MIATDILRHAGGLLAFMIVALLWSSLLPSSQPKAEHVQELAGHQPLLSLASAFSAIYARILQVDVENLAVSPDRQEPFTARRRHRRDTGVQVMSYSYAVCKGGELWVKIQEAFDGHIPAGPQFGHEDFVNGWTLKTGQSQGMLKDRWWDAFIGFANGRIPSGDQVSSLVAVQDKPFKTSSGKVITTPTGASFELQYVPKWSAMIAIYVKSPSARITDTFGSPYSHPITKEDVPTLVPPLNRLSDMSWYLYGLIGNPAGIRYIGHDWIINGNTSSIIEYLFTVKFGIPDPDLSWPGLEFDIASDEGKALLATPNSLAVAYMLIDHAAVLGKRRAKAAVSKPNPDILFNPLIKNKVHAPVLDQNDHRRKDHHILVSLEPFQLSGRHAELEVIDGPGDSRVTASQVINDEGLLTAWSDKVLIITDVASGTGIETVRAIASTGSTVFGIVRNVEKERKALGPLLIGACDCIFTF
ncbi:MAG: hypothetical protein Q9166_000651 [cf. Caloplaca sp. 2 TL-2023]